MFTILKLRKTNNIEIRAYKLKPIFFRDTVSVTSKEMCCGDQEYAIWYMQCQTDERQ